MSDDAVRQELSSFGYGSEEIEAILAFRDKAGVSDHTLLSMVRNGMILSPLALRSGIKEPPLT